MKMLTLLLSQRRRGGAKKIDCKLIQTVILTCKSSKDLKVKNNVSQRKTLILSDKNFILKANNYINLSLNFVMRCD